jgi:hypothetical protein
VEKGRGQHLRAEPLGQCLLRRADLDRLRTLFCQYGRPDPEPYGGRRLRELVDEALDSQPGRYFFEHGRRVLKSEERAEAAWEQVEAEYARFLEESNEVGPSHRAGNSIKRIPAIGSDDFGSTTAAERPKERRTRMRTTVLLQIVRGKLRGGAYKIVDGASFLVVQGITEVLRRCYLRIGRATSTLPHRPQTMVFCWRPETTWVVVSRSDRSAAPVTMSCCLSPTGPSNHG